MTLSAGTKLGPYEILSPLGAGGMGEVYKAQDTRLERTVAVKVLPTHMSASPEVRQRFEREAKTISQLSHPHICALYDVGREGETEYLVMEYLEGETLADRLAKGPLPLEQTLAYGVEIADALDKAHRQGIVHRDLKPGNVMLTKSGVKLLDFGLAKAMAPAAAEVEPDVAPDAAEPDAGRHDPRDVPVHGARAARGEGRGCANGHLRLRRRPLRDGDGEEGLRGGKPGLVDHRDHVERAGADLLGAADVARRARSRREDMPRQGSRGPLAERGGRRPAAASGWVKRRKPEPASPYRPWPVAVAAPQPGARSRSAYSSVRVSRRSSLRRGPGGAEPAAGFPLRLELDLATGERLLTASTYRRRRPPDRAGRPRHRVRRSQGCEHRAAVSKPGDGRVAIHPGNRRSLGPFLLARWPLGRIHARGSVFSGSRSRAGAPLDVADKAAARGATWGTDGTIYFARELYGGISRVSQDGGAVTAVTELDKADGEKSHRWPALLPGGKALIYAALTGRSWDEAQIVLKRLDTGERRVLIRGGTSPHYAPTGHLVYGRAQSLFAVPFDLERLAVTGQPVETARDVYIETSGAADAAFASSGLLVYVPSSSIQSRRLLTRVDRRGIGGPLSDRREAFQMPDISPDGTRIAIMFDAAVWIFDVPRRTFTPLTSGPRASIGVWAPDGKTRILRIREKRALEHLFAAGRRKRSGVGSLAERCLPGSGRRVSRRQEPALRGRRSARPRRFAVSPTTHPRPLECSPRRMSGWREPASLRTAGGSRTRT